MYIIVASATILVLSFIIQLTKLAPNKKLYIMDLLLVIVGGMAIYSETIHKFGDFTEQLKEAFSKQYSIEFQLEDTHSRNRVFDHSYQLYYGVRSDGVSTFFKSLINKAIKENKQGIYINLQGEIQTLEQAIQLFGTNNLHELVHFTQQKPTLIAIDNLHLSLSKKQCFICQILSQLHKYNSTTIVTSSKELSNLNYYIDEYTVNIMELKEFQNGKQSNFRYDWNQEAINQGRKYEDYIVLKQKEFASSLNESEKNLMSLIRRQMCKTKCENMNIRLDNLNYQYGDLKNLVDKNYVIAQLGQLRFYNNFIFESLQYL